MNTATYDRQNTSRMDEGNQGNSPPALQPSRLPVSPSVAREFDIGPTEWRVLVDQIFPSAKSVEAVMMALAYCRKRNLDIFKKPVHIVPMWSSAKKAMVETVWPGIAEIRTTASRTGEYAGIDEVEFGPMIEREFTGIVEQWENRQKVETKVTKLVRYPEWAKVTVYRMNHGNRCAFTARIFWEEMYASTGKSELPNEMWAKRTRGQLDKCVEAAALRKAFPEELGSMYAAEEMEGRNFDGPVIDHETQKKPPSPPKVEIDAPADTVDADGVIHGEIIPRDAETPPAGEFEQTDDNEFFTALEGAMDAATDAADVEDVWTNADPLARFEGTPNVDANQAISLQIKKRALKRIGGK